MFIKCRNIELCKPLPYSSIIVELLFLVPPKCEQEGNVDENLIEPGDPQGGHKRVELASITNNRTSSSHYQPALQSRYVNIIIIVK